MLRFPFALDRKVVKFQNFKFLIIWVFFLVYYKPGGFGCIHLFSIDQNQNCNFKKPTSISGKMGCHSVANSPGQVLFILEAAKYSFLNACNDVMMKWLFLLYIQSLIMLTYSIYVI